MNNERAIAFVQLHSSKMGILIPYHVIIVSQLNDQNFMRCYIMINSEEGGGLIAWWRHCDDGNDVDHSKEVDGDCDCWW